MDLGDGDRAATDLVLRLPGARRQAIAHPSADDRGPMTTTIALADVGGVSARASWGRRSTALEAVALARSGLVKMDVTAMQED